MHRVDVAKYPRFIAAVRQKLQVYLDNKSLSDNQLKRLIIYTIVEDLALKVRFEYTDSAKFLLLDDKNYSLFLLKFGS